MTEFADFGLGWKVQLLGGLPFTRNVHRYCTGICESLLDNSLIENVANNAKSSSILTAPAMLEAKGGHFSRANALNSI